MSTLTLAQTQQILAAAFAEARAKGYKPMGVVVVDAAGQVKAQAREDGASALRLDIASAKASAATGMGVRCLGRHRRRGRGDLHRRHQGRRAEPRLTRMPSRGERSGRLVLPQRGRARVRIAAKAATRASKC